MGPIEVLTDGMAQYLLGANAAETSEIEALMTEIATTAGLTHNTGVWWSFSGV